MCTHGNPTWSYLWVDFLHRLAPDWRVVAVDQTGMGFSERPGPRKLADRVAELAAFCHQETSGPLVLVAHDWGGPIALGASTELDVRAMILGNTGVARPEGVAVPPLIETARRAVDLVCRRTPTFVAGTAAMTSSRHRRALRAPYRTAERRRAVADFVADIPLAPEDPSWAALRHSAEALEDLERRQVPLLFVWGGRDPVFHDRFLADLLERAPHADVHRFAAGGHLVPLDEPMADVASAWLERVLAPPTALAPAAVAPPPPARFRPVSAALGDRAGDDTPAYTGTDATMTWRELATRVDVATASLVAAGLRRGERVALLVPPGADLLVAAYGTWSAGATLVVADAGLGPSALRRALRGATPTWVIGTRRTLLAARALGLTPGRDWCRPTAPFPARCPWRTRWPTRSRPTSSCGPTKSPPSSTPRERPGRPSRFGTPTLLSRPNATP